MSTAAAMARAAPSVTVVWRDSVVTSMGCRGSSWRLDAGRWAGARGLLEGKDTGARTRVEGRRRQGIDGQGIDGEVGQAGVDGAPGRAPVDALEHAATPGASVEGGWSLGVNGQGQDASVRQAKVGSAPARATVDALVDATDPSVPIEEGAGLEGGRRLGVDRQG